MSGKQRLDARDGGHEHIEPLFAALGHEEALQRRRERRLRRLFVALMFLLLLGLALLLAWVVHRLA